MFKMFSGRGYCTQPTCFPVLGAPPVLVFLCKTHCRHMLCYRHWLSHQTTIVDDQQEMDHSSSSRNFKEMKIRQCWFVLFSCYTWFRSWWTGKCSRSFKRMYKSRRTSHTGKEYSSITRKYRLSFSYTKKQHEYLYL